MKEVDLLQTRSVLMNAKDDILGVFTSMDAGDGALLRSAERICEAIFWLAVFLDDDGGYARSIGNMN